MAEKLSDKRCRFSVAISKLVQWTNQQPGYSCAFDEVKRTKEQALANAKSGKGIANSVHLIGLAADLILYKDGLYQTGSEAYRFMGDYWKAMGKDHRWGGDFSRPDGNHFSIEHNGVK
jgi:hypothetical protein